MRHILVALFIFFTANVSAQSVLNDKAFYDTLFTNKLFGRLGVGFNLNDDGSARKIFLLQDASLSYASSRHLFEWSDDLYFNRRKEETESNRFRTFLRMAFFRHHFEGKRKISEADFYPEFNMAFMYDESRGLNARVTSTAGITYSMHRVKWARLKIGTGISREWESWRVFDKELFPRFDSLDPVIKGVLASAYGINSRGNIVKPNWRWSSYLQFVCMVAGKVQLSALGQIQYPLQPNFESTINSPYFPVSGSRFPRLTADLSGTLFLSSHLSFFVRYFIQKDKGQLSPYAKQEVSNLAQGLVYRF
ncbi:MAG: hypothetical protein RL596_1910 [Bacteroidota bacterium]